MTLISRLVPMASVLLLAISPVMAGTCDPASFGYSDWTDGECETYFMATPTFVTEAPRIIAASGGGAASVSCDSGCNSSSSNSKPYSFTIHWNLTGVPDSVVSGTINCSATGSATTDCQQTSSIAVSAYTVRVVTDTVCTITSVNQCVGVINTVASGITNLTWADTQHVTQSPSTSTSCTNCAQ